MNCTYDAVGNRLSMTDDRGTTDYTYVANRMLSAGDHTYTYAFGGIFTGITSPYNTVGLTGRSYDPKAGLVEFYSRWYDPSVGRER